MIDDRATSPAQVTWLDPHRTFMFRALLVFLLIDPLIIIAVLLAVGMPLLVVALVVAGIIAIPALVIWLIVITAWRPFARRYPPAPLRDGAVGRAFQSLFLGPLTRFNNCIDIVADDGHLHLQPFALLRWCGARRASIAWSALNNVRPGRWKTSLAQASLDGRVVHMPAWCLELAHPPPESPENTLHRE